MVSRYLTLATLAVVTLVAGCNAVSNSNEASNPDADDSALKVETVPHAYLPVDQAPWPVVVSADLPTTPAALVVYEIASEQLREQANALGAIFGVSAAPIREQMFGGVSHARDGQRHTYVYAHGGAAFHDVSLIGSEMPMEEIADERLWEDARMRIEQLGLFSIGHVELVPTKMGSHEVERINETTQSTERWISARSVVFAQMIDGLPTFGAGAEVSIVYGEGGAVASFSHAVRNVRSGVRARIDNPEQAIGRFLERAGREHRWNLLKAYIHRIKHVDIQEVRLGYYVPEATTPVETLEPVFELRGVIAGFDIQEQPMTVGLEWIEPACAERSIPSLAINAAPQN